MTQARTESKDVHVSKHDKDEVENKKLEAESGSESEKEHSEEVDLKIENIKQTKGDQTLDETALLRCFEQRLEAALERSFARFDQ